MLTLRNALAAGVVFRAKSAGRLTKWRASNPSMVLRFGEHNSSGTQKAIKIIKTM
jgi:hypothetical protein